MTWGPITLVPGQKAPLGSSLLLVIRRRKHLGGQWSKERQVFEKLFTSEPRTAAWLGWCWGPLCSDQEYGLPGDRTVRLVTYDTVALGEALLLGAVAEREGPSSGSCPSLAREEWSKLDCSGESPKHFTGWNLRSERYYLLLIQNGRA